MANTIFRVSPDQHFPVGTSVVACIPGQGVKLREGVSGSSAPPAPGQTAVETQTVASDGTLTFTTLTTGKEYLFYASVGGANRYVLATGA